MSTRAERARRALTDWGSTVGGFAIIVHQAFIVNPETVSWLRIVMGLTLVGVQTGVALFSQARGATPTTGGPSSSDQPPSPPEPPSPPTPSSAQSSAAEA